VGLIKTTIYCKIQLLGLIVMLVFLLAPLSWAAIYYVDATNGRDTNNGLSEATAWKTIAKVNVSRFLPGDQILFKRGEVWRETLIVPSSGIAQSSIVLGAFGSGAKPTLAGENLRVNAIVIANKNYITVDGLLCENTKGDAILIGGTSHHVTVQNCELRLADKGIGIYDPAGGGNVFQDNVIHDVRLDGISGNPHTRSVLGNETVVKRNQIFRAGRFGMFCRVNYWIIEENTVYDCGINTQSGIECVGIEIYSASPTEQSGDYNIIRRNVIFRIVSAGNEGSAMEADRWCDHNQFYYNLAYDNDGPGITIYDASNNTVYNNTFYNNALNSSGELIQKGEVRLVASAAKVTTNIAVKNNIAYATKSDVYAIFIDSNTAAASLDIDRNSWYKSVGGNWWFRATVGGSDLTGWNNTPGVGNDLFVDPQFLNIYRRDFGLQATSPCLDAGVNIGLTQQDIMLRRVPQGLATDIGAFEIPSLSSPSSPTNLRRDALPDAKQIR
jgi:parallel beta-helix repeat protein